MLTDLIKHYGDPVGFLDRLPYVLELLLGVSRKINEESKGRRTQAFEEWWGSEPLELRRDIERLRHAELKALRQHATEHTETRTNVSAADYPAEWRIGDGDTFSSVMWFWSDGPFAGEHVPGALQRHLVDLRLALSKAETLLRQRSPGPS